MVDGGRPAWAAQCDQAPVASDCPGTVRIRALRAAEGVGRPHAEGGPAVVPEPTCVLDLPWHDQGCEWLGPGRASSGQGGEQRDQVWEQGFSRRGRWDRQAIRCYLGCRVARSRRSSWRVRGGVPGQEGTGDSAEKGCGRRADGTFVEVVGRSAPDPLEPSVPVGGSLLCAAGRARAVARQGGPGPEPLRRRRHLWGAIRRKSEASWLGLTLASEQLSATVGRRRPSLACPRFASHPISLSAPAPDTL